MFGPPTSAAVIDEIKLVLFDIDNVLCNYDRGKRVAHLAALAGSTDAFVHQAIWDSGFELLGDSGALDAVDYLRGFGERIGYPLSLDEWVEARRCSMRADCAMLEIVAALRGTVDIAVLTNNTTLVADHIDTLLPELRPLFGSKIYTSAQFSPTRSATGSAFQSSRPDPRLSSLSTISRPTLPAPGKPASLRITTRPWKRSSTLFRVTACLVSGERPQARSTPRRSGISASNATMSMR